MSETLPKSILSFLSYENSIYGLRMKYPSNWLKGVDNNNNNDNGHSNDRYVIVATFFSPLESSYDSYQECVQTVIDNAPNLGSDMQQYMLENIILTRGSCTDFRLLASNTINVMLAGKTAYEILYEHSDTSSGTIRVLETGTVIGGKGYYIQYFAEQEKYPVYLHTVQTMLDSFTLITHIDDKNFTTWSPAAHEIHGDLLLYNTE